MLRDYPYINIEIRFSTRWISKAVQFQLFIPKLLLSIFVKCACLWANFVAQRILLSLSLYQSFYAKVNIQNHESDIFINPSMPKLTFKIMRMSLPMTQVGPHCHWLTHGIYEYFETSQWHRRKRMKIDLPKIIYLILMNFGKGE
jgi:hypothetical protein